jgi:hypothetical protein
MNDLGAERYVWIRPKAMNEDDVYEVQASGPFHRFKLVRAVDVTGISGVGEIAVGVQFPDQSCVLLAQAWHTWLLQAY